MAGKDYATMKYGSLFGRMSTATTLWMKQFSYLRSTRAVPVGMRLHRRDSMEGSRQPVLSVLSESP